MKQYTEVDDYFNAPRWRPSHDELAQAVDERIVKQHGGYLVLPGYFNSAQTQRMLMQSQDMFHGRCCGGGQGDNARGIGNTWFAESFNSDLGHSIMADSVLREAAKRILLRSPRIAQKLANHTHYIEPYAIATHQDMSTCPPGGCPNQMVAPASGWHVDCLKLQVKVLVYLNDVHGDNGPFTVMRGYPKVVDEYGWLRPDPAVLPVCSGEVDERGDHVLRFGTGDVIEMMRQSNSTRAVEIHAPAGTAVVFDITSVHTGKGLNQGSRDSVTALYPVKEVAARELFPGKTTSDHAQRALYGMGATDSPAVRRVRAALSVNAPNADVTCRQMSKWAPPGTIA